jgi:hypothetical protein
MSRAQFLKRLLSKPEASAPLRSVQALVTEANLTERTDVVAAAQKLDDQLAQIRETNVLADAFSHFKYFKYVKGEEDAVPEPNFAFYREHISDPVIVDMVEAQYQKFLKAAEAEGPTLPKEWSGLEEAMARMVCVVSRVSMLFLCC